MKTIFNSSLWSVLLVTLFFCSTWVCAENLQLQTPNTPPLAGSNTPLSLEDIQGPVSIAEPVNWWMYCAISLGIVMSLVLLLWFLKRRKKTIPPPSFAKIALQKMEDISPLQKDDPLLYVSKISIITREYIEKRFSIPSSKTTGQFFQSLEKSSQIPQAYDHDFFKKFFSLFDMAKFAQRSPTSEEIKKIEDAIRDFIHKGGDNALS